MVDKILFFILVIAIGGALQRGVPILSLVSWPTYKIIVVVISFLYLFRIIANKSIYFNKGLKVYNVFLSINLIWALISGIVPHFSYLSGLLTGLLPIYPFYYLKYTGKIGDREMLLSLLYLIVVSVFSYYGWNAQIMEEKNIDFFTNNIGYYFVPLFNIVYFLRKNTIRYVLIMIIVLFVLASAKRGAQFCLLFEIIVYLYLIFYRNKKKGTVRKIAAIIGVVLSIFIITSNFSEDSYSIQRINNTFTSSDKTDVYSGRDVIYATYLENYFKSGPKEMLFGNGFNATMDMYDLNAHNDWIEILVDYGFITAIVYLLFFIYTFRHAKIINEPIYKYALYSVIGTMFIQTLFSMGFTSMSMSVTAMLLGFLFAASHGIKRQM